MACWSQLTIQPNPAALAALRQHWRWQLGESWKPLLFSAIGDVFLEVPAGTVWWLSTATAALEQVADSRQAFVELLGTERIDEWLLPGLVDVLIAQGKVLAADGCYTYVILPVFTQGSFSAENMHAVAAAEHFTHSGRVHEGIRQLPDGAQVHTPLAG